MNAGLLVLLLLAASSKRGNQRSPGSTGKPARGGPWWPGPDEDNLGVVPVPADRHPQPAAPPLK